MEVMDDVIFVAVFIATMTLTFDYVRLCERIVRLDEPSGRHSCSHRSAPASVSSRS